MGNLANQDRIKMSQDGSNTQYAIQGQPLQLVTLSGSQILNGSNGQQIQLIQSGSNGINFGNGQQIITLATKDGGENREKGGNQGKTESPGEGRVSPNPNKENIQQETQSQ